MPCARDSTTTTTTTTNYNNNELLNYISFKCSRIPHHASGQCWPHWVSVCNHVLPKPLIYAWSTHYSWLVKRPVTTVCEQNRFHRRLCPCTEENICDYAHFYMIKQEKHHVFSRFNIIQPKHMFQSDYMGNLLIILTKTESRLSLGAGLL